MFKTFWCLNTAAPEYHCDFESGRSLSDPDCGIDVDTDDMRDKFVVTKGADHTFNRSERKITQQTELKFPFSQRKAITSPCTPPNTGKTSELEFRPTTSRSPALASSCSSGSTPPYN